MPLRSPRSLALLTAPLLLLASACGDADGGPAEQGSTGSAGTDGQLQVVTSFYPLEHLATRIAGEHAEVSTLTAPGVDPHDVELSPRTVGSLGSADLVIYSAGLQPAVDQAVAAQAPAQVLDAAEHADLLALGETAAEHAAHEDEHQHDAVDAEDATDDGHDDDGHDTDDAHDAHDHGDEDPHFWLDPERYGQVAEAIADRLAQIDPDHEQAYRDNAADVLTELDGIDESFATALASCESRDLVTTHEAFGYLAHRYDLHQIGITGISPEAEPSAARLAEVAAQVRELGVTTVFAEPILTTEIAQTVARETGAQVLTLDPVEGITDSSAGEGYREVMEANLQALREGLRCS